MAAARAWRYLRGELARHGEDGDGLRRPIAVTRPLLGRRTLRATISVVQPLRSVARRLPFDTVTASCTSLIYEGGGLAPTLRFFSRIFSLDYRFLDWDYRLALLLASLLLSTIRIRYVSNKFTTSSDAHSFQGLHGAGETKP